METIYNLKPKEAFDYLEGIDPGAIKEHLDHIQKGYIWVIEYEDYLIMKKKLPFQEYLYEIRHQGNFLDTIDIELTFKEKEKTFNRDKWRADMEEFERLKKESNERKADSFEYGDCRKSDL